MGGRQGQLSPRAATTEPSRHLLTLLGVSLPGPGTPPAWTPHGPAPLMGQPQIPCIGEPIHCLPADPAIEDQLKRVSGAQPTSKSRELRKSKAAQGHMLHRTAGPWLVAIPRPGARWLSSRGRMTGVHAIRFLKSSFTSQIPVPRSSVIWGLDLLDLSNNPPTFSLEQV